MIFMFFLCNSQPPRFYEDTRFARGDCDISNILGTVWCVESKVTGHVVGDVELTKRKRLHPNTNASTRATATLTGSTITTAIIAKAITTNSATSTTATPAIGKKKKG